jgi:hypothetical protein
MHDDDYGFVHGRVPATKYPGETFAEYAARVWPEGITPGREQACVDAYAMAPMYATDDREAE